MKHGGYGYLGKAIFTLSNHGQRHPDGREQKPFSGGRLDF